MCCNMLTGPLDDIHSSSPILVVAVALAAARWADLRRRTARLGR
jgi:hypothetical protein